MNRLCDCIFSLQVLLPAESRHAAVCFSSEDMRYHRNVAHSEKLSLAKVNHLGEAGKVGSRTSRDLPMPRVSVPTVALLEKPVKDACAVQQSNSQRLLLCCPLLVLRYKSLN